jgi:poly-gamma-glutamate synthesis protein (capsule biosynthesis protein)
MMDGGVTGYFDYISHLEESGIDYFGCGSDTDHMKNYILVEQKGIRVILYNVMEFFFNGATEKCPGGNLYDETRVLEELRELRKNCDHLVVLYHGGFESTFYNTPLIRTRFHRMADAGADILISQHTHAIGNEEEYHGSLLIYGQGNFCFNLAKKVNDCLLRGMLLNFIFTKEGYRVERHVVRRTEIGCVYDEEQDLSEQRERTKMHDRLLAGDPEAENVFLQENRKVSKVFIERLLKGFYGAIELPPFSEKQIRILLLMLQAEEMNEMAVCYFTELLEKYEKESE